MDNVEIVDLSKELVMYQGRKTEQSHSNLRAEEKFAKERDNFEYQIRAYKGNDPLKPYYNYVTWLEQNYSSDLVLLLENVLVKFKENCNYKQDPRLIYILIKYISTQHNPLELYQLVYDQGLGIKCSTFYQHWAEELDKVNDFKAADRIFQLGFNLRAQPEEELRNAHLRFQLGIAKRVLQGNIIFAEQSTTQVLNRKCDKQLVDVRKQEIKKRHTLETGEVCRDRMVDRRLLRNQGNRRRSERPTAKSEFKCPIAIFEPPDSMKKPMYPKDLVYVEGRDIQLEEIRAAYFLKLEREHERKLGQELTEPNNVTKSPVSSSETCSMTTRSVPKTATNSTLKRTYSDSNLPLEQNWCLRTEFILPVEKPLIVESSSTTLQKSSRVLDSDVSVTDRSWYLRTEFIEPVKIGQSSVPTTIRKFPSESRLSTKSTIEHLSEFIGSEGEVEAGCRKQNKPQKQIEDEVLNYSNHTSKSCISVHHNSPTASFTFNTRAAMNVIQKMWESPLAPRRAKLSRPANECDLFKISAMRKPECFAVADEDDANREIRSVDLPTFPVYHEEAETRSETDIYARLSTRASSRKAIVVEDGLSSTMNSLQICDKYENRAEAVRAPFIIPVQLPDAPQQLENKKHDSHEKEFVTNDHKLEPIQTQDENDENKIDLFDETCSTKAFAMLLPSSTPFSRPDRSRRSRKSSIFNRSYVAEEDNTGVSNQPKFSAVKVTNNISTVNGTKNPTNLSLILENSKEQGYSSSGGNVPKSFFLLNFLTSSYLDAFDKFFFFFFFFFLNSFTVFKI